MSGLCLHNLLHPEPIGAGAVVNATFEISINVHIGEVQVATDSNKTGGKSSVTPRRSANPSSSVGSAPEPQRSRTPPLVDPTKELAEEDIVVLHVTQEEWEESGFDRYTSRRHYFFSAKFSLKGSGFYVTEYLTPEKANSNQPLRETHAKAGMAWSLMIGREDLLSC
ncbi:Hypp741 [Branchiostoma lanceolatum]|uniref:Hypp741 protein n=1 Tax=Branchiostoma lanceolatum TaxID=7740 RepID=A0A8J9W1J3_BRALA|nr:Hypp741 [Branchiostoma lanceolatum]